MSFTVPLSLCYLLVVLFLPLSSLDKILNFSGAVAQARVSRTWHLSGLLRDHSVALEAVLEAG